jgi:hypothetical protein
MALVCEKHTQTPGQTHNLSFASILDFAPSVKLFCSDGGTCKISQQKNDANLTGGCKENKRSERKLICLVFSF